MLRADPILKMEGYRMAIRVDPACELALSKLSDTAERTEINCEFASGTVAVEERVLYPSYRNSRGRKPRSSYVERPDQGFRRQLIRVKD